MRNHEILKNFFSMADDVIEGIPSILNIKYEITKKDDSVELEIALPGYDKDDIIINTEGHNLFIETKSSMIINKWKSNFKRAFKMSDGLNYGKINASFKNGILNISIPKAKKSKRVDININ